MASIGGSVGHMKAWPARSVASPSRRRSATRQRRVRATRSTATSAPRAQTRCGSGTSPTSRHGRGLCHPMAPAPWGPRCSRLHYRRLRPAHRRLAGEPHREHRARRFALQIVIRTPCSTPSNRRSTTAVPTTAASSTIATGALNTCRFDTERLAEAGIEPSVGSVGNSYDNALAETINGLFKAEVIHRRGPWRSFEAVEYATLEWSTGSTIAASSRLSGISRPPKPKPTTMPPPCRSLWRHDSNQTASGNPDGSHHPETGVTFHA